MSNRLILALAACWLFLLACVTWFVLDPLKYALVGPVLRARVRPSLAQILAMAIAHIGVAGVLLLLAVAVIGLILIAMEWRSQLLSRMISKGGAYSAALMFCVVLWLGHSYFVPGHLLMGDLGTHITLVALRSAAILSGHDPNWTNWQDFGQPIPSYYSPTTFLPASWIALLVGDPTVATKIFLFLAHALSGLAAWWLARRLGARPMGAFIAAIGYAGSFAHLHLILHRGTVPQALTVALLPFAFGCLHLVLRERRFLSFAWGGLVLGSVALLVNYTPFGVVAGLCFVLYAALWLFSGKTPWSRLWPLASAGLLALALASVVLVPAMLAARDNPELSPQRLIDFVIPDATYFNHLLMWRAWRTNFGHDSSAYLGISLVVLAVVGAVAALRTAGRERMTAAGLCLILLLSLFLRGDYLRAIILTLMPLTILAGAGADWLLDRFPNRHSLAAIIAGLLLLDLGSTAVQPLARTDLGGLDRAGRALAAAKPQMRTLEGSSAGGQFMATRNGGAGILQLYPSEFVSGGYVQFARSTTAFGALAGRMAENDLADTGRLRPDTRELLCGLRVGRIIGLDRGTVGLPAYPDTVKEPSLGRVIPLRCAYSVIFAPALVHAAPVVLQVPGNPDSIARDADIEKPRADIDLILSAMAVDPATGIARHILSPDAGAPVKASQASVPISLPRMRSYEVGADRVRAVLATPGAGFHPPSPGLVSPADRARERPFRSDMVRCHGADGAAGSSRPGDDRSDTWTGGRAGAGDGDFDGGSAAAFVVDGWRAAFSAGRNS